MQASWTELALNSKANPVQFEWKWAGLAVFSRQHPNGSNDLKKISQKNTFAFKFLTNIILVIGGVYIFLVFLDYLILQRSNTTFFKD